MRRELLMLDFAVNLLALLGALLILGGACLVSLPLALAVGGLLLWAAALIIARANERNRRAARS
jgi:hypothetical protein